MTGERSRIEEIDDVSSQLIQIFHFLITQFRFTFIDNIFVPFIYEIHSESQVQSGRSKRLITRSILMSDF